jgi:hypothetical protein
MFDNRYSTRGVAESVDLSIQLIMWGMIDRWKSQNKELDYLQVFDVSTEYSCGHIITKVEHHQEIPELKEVLYYNDIANPINAKIFVIDDGEHATMMFSYEY